MDALDRRILNVLLQDAQTHFRTIAQRCGSTVGTVHNRVRKMKEAGVIKRFIPELDARALGYDICALIDMKIEGKHLKRVQDELAKDTHVVAVYDVTGEFDTTFVAKFHDTVDLDNFVKRTLQHPHVKETRTKLVLNVVKEGFTPRLPG